jgi:hypothetical protein
VNVRARAKAARYTCALIAEQILRNVKILDPSWRIASITCKVPFRGAIDVP